MALTTCRQLKAARALAGWTQRDLGVALGVDERQIRFWEKRIPTNTRKRQMLEHVFEDAGVEFVSDPKIGVRMTGM
jgi:transcriptional regulator with XRE-family HTH domain